MGYETIEFAVFSYGFIIKYNDLPQSFKMKRIFNGKELLDEFEPITHEHEKDDIIDCIMSIIENFNQKFEKSGIRISTRITGYLYDYEEVINSTSFFISLFNPASVDIEFVKEKFIELDDILIYPQENINSINNLSEYFGKTNKWILFMGKF